MSIRQLEEFEVKISNTIVDDFAKISGDFNPLHLDDEFASKTTFGKRIVHGMLLASFFSRLVGMKIPGKNGIYFSQSLNFRKPCFIGDVIKVVGTVIDKSESTKIVTLKTEVFNQNNECLVDGESKVLYYK
ncbi:MAG: enoyl-CoA hydratase [Thaumarchaeota archaeon]|nr:MAG: enoyl-CoA hydratase [Nitrososphaerota archaeon]